MILKLGKLWFNSQFSQAIIKVWSTFSKVVGVGKAHKYFPFMQFGGLNTTAKAIKCDSNKKRNSLFN